jgi:DNA-binding LytR/AlgR family response regulator
MNNDIEKFIKIKEHSLASFLLKNSYEKINYFESDGDLTFIVLDDGSKIQLQSYLHQLEKILPPNIFFRCGWSFLVNITKIREYWMLEYPFLVMSNGDIVPVSQVDKERVKKQLFNKVIIKQD